MQPLSAEKAKGGDHFGLRLAEPIVIDGATLVAAGATGEGEVIDAKPGGIGGRPGRLVLAARYLDSGGVHMKLQSLKLGGGGKDRSATAVGVVIAVGVLGALVQGGGVDYPAGTLASAKIASDVSLSPPSAPATPSVRLLAEAAAGPAAPRRPGATSWATPFPNWVPHLKGPCMRLVTSCAIAALTLSALTLTAMAPGLAQAADAAKPADAASAVPTPPSGKGQVVFFRRSSLMGFPYWTNIRENDTAYGKLSNGVYFVQTLDPGPHTFNTSVLGKDALKIEVDPGETYYVEGKITMALVGYTVVMAPSDATAFQKAFHGMKLAKLAVAGPPATPTPRRSRRRLSARGDLAFLRPGAGQDVDHAVVALVAGVFVHRAARGVERHLGPPRPAVEAGVGIRNFSNSRDETRVNRSTTVVSGETFSRP